METIWMRALYPETSVCSGYKLWSNFHSMKTFILLPRKDHRVRCWWCQIFSSQSWGSSGVLLQTAQGVTLSLELFCILSVITRPAASQLRRTHNQAGRRDVSGSRETLVPFFIPKILAGEELCVSLQPGLFPKRNLSYSKWWNHLFVQRLPGTFLYNGSLSVK